jgi:hypothetical protein
MLFILITFSESEVKKNTQSLWNFRRFVASKSYIFWTPILRGVQRYINCPKKYCTLATAAILLKNIFSWFCHKFQDQMGQIVYPMMSSARAFGARYRARAPSTSILPSLSTCSSTEHLALTLKLIKIT